MSLHAWWLRVAVALALAACGGGGDGVGSGGTGAPVVHSGTVTGFGSVIVDGTAYDDGAASVSAESAEGRPDAATLRLGHRIELELGDSASVARAIRVQAEVRGTVDAVSAGGLRLLGQDVRVNTDVRAGPRTLFGGGLASLSDVAPGDRVEVHGFRRRIGGVWIVQATRIDGAPAASGLLVAGVVEALDTAGGVQVFRIAGLQVDAADARVVPADRSLANGRRVTVWADAGALSGPADAPLVAARRVRIQVVANGAFEAALAGGIDAVDAAAGRLQLGDVTVDFSQATVVPPVAEPAAGQYARVQGRWADDGSFVATRVILRGLDAVPAADLTGVVADWNAATQRFSVRGTAVDGVAATLENCPAAGLADGLRVQVHGDLGDAGVVATTVKCIGS
jgi:hypothetical protein